MQAPEVNHASATRHYNPPSHVAKQIIAHAVRNISGSDKILRHCYPKPVSYHQLPPNKHIGNGRLEWSFLN